MTQKEAEKQYYKTILQIRAKTIEYFREWLNKQGFTEIQGPILTPLLTEKSGFTVKYRRKTMSLSSGLQPYTDTYLDLFCKFYTLSPTFRAEPKATGSHLIEFWRLEVNALNINLEGILRIQEQLITHTISQLIKEMSTELTTLGSIEALEKIKTPFSQLPYDAAIEKLQKIGEKVHWGNLLTSELLEPLSKSSTEPFFITESPVNGETLFYKTDPKKPELSLSADLIAPEGYGEIASCGEPLTNKKIITEKMNELGISTEDQKWYLNLKRFNQAPQAGFALGVERFLMWLCDQKNISKTTLFPRTNESILAPHFL